MEGAKQNEASETASKDGSPTNYDASKQAEQSWMNVITLTDDGWRQHKDSGAFE